MFSATHFLKGLSCLNSPGTPQQLFAALRRQPNSTEKSVNATISYAEQRPFKTPQLPALRAVVTGQSGSFDACLLFCFFFRPPQIPETRPRPSGVHGCCPLPKEGTQRLIGPNMGGFFFSAFRSTGRPKWVRASARNCGWRIAGRDACPTRGWVKPG